MPIPVTIADARRQLRLEVDDESRDDDLTAYIADAAAWVETITGHILVGRDVKMMFPGQSHAILSAWPIKPDSIPMISFDGDDGEPVAFDARLEVYGRPARVVPLAGFPWPFTSADQRFAVTIRAGYEAGDVVPGDLKRAMLILITAYDEDREGGALFQTAVESARMLCEPFRVIGL